MRDHRLRKMKWRKVQETEMVLDAEELLRYCEQNAKRRNQERSNMMQISELESNREKIKENKKLKKDKLHKRVKQLQNMSHCKSFKATLENQLRYIDAQVKSMRDQDKDMQSWFDIKKDLKIWYS